MEQLREQPEVAAGRPQSRGRGRLVETLRRPPTASGGGRQPPLPRGEQLDGNFSAS